MFAEMKNKIREKSGGDLPKLPSPAVVLRGKHSRQSSGSSISSLMQDSAKDDKPSVADCNGTKSDASGSESSLPKLKQIRSEDSTANGTDEREKQWRNKEQGYVDDLLKQTRELQAALKKIEDYESKFNTIAEEKEQLENFQTQEMAKIKHLLLAKENENSAHLAHLKENEKLMESLKAEVSRLKPFEEKVSTLEDDIEVLRHTSERERWQLSSKLAQSEEEISHLKERVAVLSRRAQAECQALGAQLTVDERIQSLLGERSLLERRLEEAHIHLSEIKTSWSEKISYLETQVERLGRQAVEEGSERRKTEEKIEELERRLTELQEEKSNLLKKIEDLTCEKDTHIEELKALEEKNNAVTSDKTEIVERLNEAMQKHASLEEQVRTLEANNTELRAEIKVFKETLIRERRATEETKRSLTQVGAEKDDALMRNAEMSMKAQLAEKSLKMLRQENDELTVKVKTYETVLKKQDEEKSSEDDKSSSSNEVNSKVVDLENQLIEKNKTIRVLQQRMSDLKKMLQKEVVNSSETNCLPRPNLDDDINLKYLKHVVIKFLTCRDYEAQHLTRAVATLLRMSADEERLLRETVDWRMSWFGTRPQLPPSQR